MLGNRRGGLGHCFFLEREKQRLRLMYGASEQKWDEAWSGLWGHLFALVLQREICACL